MNKRQYFKSNKSWNLQQTNEYFGFLEALALKNTDAWEYGYIMADLGREVPIEKYYSKSRRYWRRLIKSATNSEEVI